MIFDRASLDQDGWPPWISSLVNADRCAALYVVRGVEPASALRTVGARTEAVPFEALPGSSGPGLLAEAIDVDPSGTSILLAARLGDWTMVLDDGGWTFDDEIVEDLSAGGEAAGCSFDINAHTWLIHAVDGSAVCSVMDPVSATPLDGLSPAVRAAVAVAGIGPEDWHSGENFRTVCALAGMTGTLGDLLRLGPLAATTG